MASGLSEEEMWHFDLHGFVLVKNGVPEADIAHMVELCDRWHDQTAAGEELPAPLRCINPTTDQPPSITGIEYADDAFEWLALNPQLMCGYGWMLVDRDLSPVQRAWMHPPVVF